MIAIVSLRLSACSLLLAGVAFAAEPPPAAAPPSNPVGALPTVEEPALQLDASEKSYTAKPGETSCVLRFAVKNVSAIPVTITQVVTSCGCTVAKLPSQPWTLAPDAGGDIELTVDLRGKFGEISKTAMIYTATGFKQLAVRIALPAAPDAPRTPAEMRRIAASDRQAVFKNDCANCHAAPAAGLMGSALYQLACGICHEPQNWVKPANDRPEHNVPMVPNLRRLEHSTDRAFWKKMIEEGKEGTLMPAFAEAHGGPLTPKQVESLVEFLLAAFPSR